MLELLWQAGPCQRRRRGCAAGAAHAGAHLPGRDLRPSGRRLRPLQRRRRSGSCRISRRCSTTMPSCCACSAMHGRAAATSCSGPRRRDGRLAAPRDDGRRRASPPASTPTARARRAGSTSGRRPRSTRCWAPMPPLFAAPTASAPPATGRAQRPQPAARARPAAARRGGGAGALPRRAAGGARAAAAAGPRRQGAGRLERPDDRRPGRRRRPCFGEPDWLELAERAFAWVVAELGDGDTLRHSWRDGRRLPRGLPRRLCARWRWRPSTLYEHTGDAAYLDRARALAWMCSTTISPMRGGGYFTTASGAPDLVLRIKSGQDGPTPSGNATWRCRPWPGCTPSPAHACDERRAEGILRAFAGEVRRIPSAFAGLLSGAALAGAAGAAGARRASRAPASC